MLYKKGKEKLACVSFLLFNILAVGSFEGLSRVLAAPPTAPPTYNELYPNLLESEQSFFNLKTNYDTAFMIWVTNIEKHIENPVIAWDNSNWVRNIFFSNSSFNDEYLKKYYWKEETIQLKNKMVEARIAFLTKFHEITNTMIKENIIEEAKKHYIKVKQGLAENMNYNSGLEQRKYSYFLFKEYEVRKYLEGMIGTDIFNRWKNNPNIKLVPLLINTEQAKAIKGKKGSDITFLWNGTIYNKVTYQNKEGKTIEAQLGWNEIHGNKYYVGKNGNWFVGTAAKINNTFYEFCSHGIVKYKPFGSKIKEYIDVDNDEKIVKLEKGIII